MADYTSDEIQTAVEKVVRSTIRRQYGSLGNRDIQTAFNDLQDAVAGVFMLYPNAPFYIVFLGTLRLAELIENERETVSALVEVIDNLRRTVVEVKELSLLGNARVALQSLEGAAASREGNFQSIEDVPAFKRYDSNLQRFMDTYGRNIRKGGEIVPTPQQSRAEIAGLISQLQAQHAEVVEYAAYLSVAIQDYDNMDLPSLVSASVISKSRQLLARRLEEMEGQTPEERLTGLRDAMLDLMAGRAAVRGLGSLTATTLFALIEGIGQVFADSEHPATPAALLSDKAGPYGIYPSKNELYFLMEDVFYFTGVLPGSFLANLTSVSEPYEITALVNDSLVIEIHTPSGTSPHIIPLTPGLIQTALDVCADINGGPLAGTILEAVPVLKTPRYIGTVDIADTGGGSANFTLPAGAGDWADYGVEAGAILQVTVHVESTVEGVWFGLSSIVGNVASGAVIPPQTPPVVSLNDPAAEVEVGVGRAVRLRIIDAAREDSLNGRSGFGFPADPAQLALDTLGFLLRTETYCRSTAAATAVVHRPRGSPSAVWTSSSRGLAKVASPSAAAIAHRGPCP